MKITKRQLRRIIREAVSEWHVEDTVTPDQPWGSYSEKDGGFYSDTIIMSPHGDSVLVDGRVTYVRDVPTQLEMASGFPVPAELAQALISDLERQMQQGWGVEKYVEFKDGVWSI